MNNTTGSLRICQIMGGDETGGLEKHVIDLCNSLATRHEIHVIAHPCYRSQLRGIHFHALDLTRSRRNPWLLWQTWRILHRLKPDIVHAQANKATAILASLRRFLPQTTRLVATLHSQKRRIDAYRKMDLVIGVSARVLNNLGGTRTAVIYPGLPPTQPDSTRQQVREHLQIPETVRLIVAIGRLVPVKRFDQLIEAVNGLENIVLLIAGEGALLPSLLKQAAVQPYGQVRMLGQYHDIPGLLAAADLCVISSEREGFSYVMAESLQAGTPVIATDVADMRTLLPPGFVVPVSDIAGLRKAISAALADLPAAREAFVHPFSWAREHLTIERVCTETSARYRELSG